MSRAPAVPALLAALVAALAPHRAAACGAFYYSALRTPAIMSIPQAYR